MSQQEQLERQRQVLLRISYGILGSGLGLAVLAALIGGSAVRRSAMSTVDGALVLRNIAAAILLLGLIVVLIAQRLPELHRRWGRRRRLSRPVATAGTGASRGPRRLRGLAVTLCLAWIMINGLPPAARGIAVLAASAIAPAIVAAASLYGRGPLRAFCLGCLFPLSAQLIFTSVLAATAWLSVSAWRASRFPRMLDLLGQSYGTATVFWVLAVLAGLLCVGVHRLLAASEVAGPSPPSG